jgi:drug/metabolite transporter (DMT)-like permease
MMKAVWIDRLLTVLSAALCSAALWGSNFGMVKEAVAIMPVGLFASIRFGICSLITLPTLLCCRGNHYPQGWGLLCRGLESGLWLGVANAFQAQSLRTVPASVAGFLAGAIVLMVPFLDLLASIPVTIRQLVAAVLGLMGIGFLCSDKGFDSVAPPSRIDMILALCVPFFFSVGYWRAGRDMLWRSILVM